MAENVVKLPAPRKDKRPIDLRGNNRFRDLLETHAVQAAVIAEAQRLKKEADGEIREIMGDAEKAIAEGFTVSFTTFDRKEYVVPARTMRMLKVYRRKERR